MRRAEAVEPPGQAPDGARSLGSWVTVDLQPCFQVMACDEPGVAQQWIVAWSGLVDFEVIPVVTSGQAAAAIEPRP